MLDTGECLPINNTYILQLTRVLILFFHFPPTSLTSPPFLLPTTCRLLGMYFSPLHTTQSEPETLSNLDRKPAKMVHKKIRVFRGLRNNCEDPAEFLKALEWAYRLDYKQEGT